jgi:putative nucleotidyltransferase with HDIG domain
MRPTDDQLEFATTCMLLALSARDIETACHSRRVQQLSLQLGRALQLSATDLYGLKFGAALHDVGKLATPDQILNKPARLSPEEWEVMRRHPLDGANLLRAAGFPELSCLVLEQHHEAFDGSGYPYQLKGNEISVAARVFAVADTFDAITKDRPYRKGQSSKVALDEISDFSGSQFDPQVVNALLTLHQLAPVTTPAPMEARPTTP